MDFSAAGVGAMVYGILQDEHGVGKIYLYQLPSDSSARIFD